MLGKIGLLSIIVLSQLANSCSDNKLEEKGFSVDETASLESDTTVNSGLSKDSLVFRTRPRGVLLTFHKEHRLTPLYKVNTNKETGKTFIGDNHFHYSYQDYDAEIGNIWNNHWMPGFSAVSGYNLVNISHHQSVTHTQNTFFKTPVLVKTLYYPAFKKDTLNFEAVSRNYYLVTVYNEDTNKDGFVNLRDLRRMFYFDLDGKNQEILVPENYSVISSEYDSANDFMYVFAKYDENKNGKIDSNEEEHIFWIDLKNPENRGRQY